MKLPPSAPHRPWHVRALRFVLLLACSLYLRGSAADSPPIAPTDNATYAKTAQASSEHVGGDDLNQRILQLWSDNPAFVKLFNDKTKAKRAARVQSTVAPVPPLVPALPGVSTHVQITVSFMVDETGGVEAARVLNSTDPRFNQAAIDAVLQWRFFPAEGEHGFIKSHFVVPILFNGERPKAISIGLAVHPPVFNNETIVYMPGQTPPPRTHTSSISIGVQLQGPGAADVKSGRILVSHAVDDTGADLGHSSNPTFYHAAVGSISSDDFIRTPLTSLNISLGGANLAAKKISSVEGQIELVIPRLDPTGAVAVIENVPAQIGAAINSPALNAAGVTVVIYDQSIVDRFIADKNAGDNPPTPGAPDLFKKPEMTENDLAIGVTDPQGKLVGFEFQTANGRPVRYNHNGWYHSGDSPGRRFDVYRMESKLPPDAKLVCWLITPQSLYKIPLKLADLPLPASSR